MAGGLERSLETALLACMGPKVSQSNRQKNALFEVNQPLSSFSAKILCGYAFGLYGSTTRNDLDTIRRIRNVFAHTTNPITFETDAIKASCENLKLPSKIRPSEIPLPNFILNPSGSKERFVSTTLIIMGQLRLELAEGKNSPTGPISLP